MNLEGMIVSGKMIYTVAAAALALCLGTGFAYAAADDAIKGRQGCMKAQGKMMGVLAPMFKGEQPYDKATVDAAIVAHDAACAGWADWWGPDSQKGETVETWAKPEIWTDPAGFTAVGDAFYAKFIAVKDSTDEASFKAAFPALGQACGGCHEKFRRPKD
jgi:cytochrome c556